MRFAIAMGALCWLLAGFNLGALAWSPAATVLNSVAAIGCLVCAALCTAFAWTEDR